MEAQSYTAEERRAANQVWAAAEAYGFEPLFLARNTDGTIDFYMNWYSQPASAVSPAAAKAFCTLCQKMK